MLHAHNEILQKSEGYLSLNKEVKVLDEVVYYNKRLETYEPKDFIKSLWTQKSLILNRELYLSLFNGEDFVTAKRNQYKNFSYDRSLGEYTQKIPSIATWKRLTHPPLKYSESSIGLNNKLSDATNKQFQSKEFAQYISDQYNVKVSYGNKPEVLINGNFFSTLVDDINKAKKSLFISNMFLKCDPGSKFVFQAIENAVKRKVKVYLILDKVFTLLNNPKCIKKLKKIGVNTKLLLSGLLTAPREMNPFDKRTAKFYHTKSWVIDSRVAYISGGNVIDTQVISKPNEFNYRDTGVKVIGPVVSEIAKDFRELYLKSRRDFYLESLDLEPKEIISNSGLCFYLHNWKKENKDSINNLLIDLVKKSKKHLYMNSLDSLVRTKKNSVKNKFYQAVDNALKRGITVDLMLNGHWGAWSPYEIPGHMLKKDVNLVTETLKKRYKKLDYEAILASRDYVLERKDLPLRAHRFFQFNHNKIMLVDGSLGLIGTHNLETRSFNGNIENLIACSDEKFIKDLKHILSIDIANSYPIVD